MEHKSKDWKHYARLLSEGSSVIKIVTAASALFLLNAAADAKSSGREYALAAQVLIPISFVVAAGLIALAPAIDGRNRTL